MNTRTIQVFTYPCPDCGCETTHKVVKIGGKTILVCVRCGKER